MEAAIVPTGLCIITLPVSKIPLIARKAGWRFRNAANLDRIPYVKTARGCAWDDRELARERYLSIARHPHSFAPMERSNCTVSRPRLFSAFSFSFFFLRWFLFLDLASRDSREVFRIFRGFFSLSFFFIGFVELRLFLYPRLQRFSRIFSNFSYFCRIGSLRLTIFILSLIISYKDRRNFFEFFFFVRFLELGMEL